VLSVYAPSEPILLETSGSLELCALRDESDMRDEKGSISHPLLVRTYPNGGDSTWSILDYCRADRLRSLSDEQIFTLLHGLGQHSLATLA
jgi:hypothetical protein